MKVKAIASFFHGGSRKVGDEFEVSDHAGGLLKAKGLVSLGADVELNTSWTSPNAVDGLGDGSQPVADSDTGVGRTSGASDQSLVVAADDAATKEGKAVVEPAQAELVPVSAKSGKADAGKTKRSE